MTTAVRNEPPRSAGRGLLLAALVVAIIGVAVYAGQIAAARLFVPWYLPATGTLAVILVGAALWQRRGILRVLTLLFLLLLCGAEWAMLLGARLPEYTGPVAVGQPIPAFATVRADGTTFTQRDLEGDQATVLVFFRGRW